MKNRIFLYTIIGTIIFLLLVALIIVNCRDTSGKNNKKVEYTELMSKQKDEELARRIANEERIREKKKEQLEEIELINNNSQWVCGIWEYNGYAKDRKQKIQSELCIKRDELLWVLNDELVYRGEYYVGTDAIYYNKVGENSYNDLFLLDVKRKQIEYANNEYFNKSNNTKICWNTKEWLYGNWECSGYDEFLGRYTMFVIITKNTIRWGYNGKESYNGPYEINMEDRKIYFNRHNGFSTHINFDPQNHRLSDGEGHYFKKVNSSRANHSNGYHGNNNSSNTHSNVHFNRDSDVIAYTSSHTFKNSMGNRISISFRGMSVNGSLLTNAPRVIYFNGSTATISVSSPYTGGGAMIISVDASRGTITDGSGDVFWMVN